MRNLIFLDVYRIRHPIGGMGDSECGCFDIPSKTDGQSLRIMASALADWDHVSVSRVNRCPNWPEMEQIRRLFFRDDEAAYQFHAPIADYVDGSKFGHPYCLHLWRPQKAEIPIPPKWMVGGMSFEEAEIHAKAAGL